MLYYLTYSVMFNSHRLEIIRDTQISEIKEEWIDEALYDCPISQQVDPDMRYNDNQQERHILKHLRCLD